MKEDKLSIIVKSRDGIVFEGKAKSVTSNNEKGRFDILPNHANFITIINKELIIERSKAKKEYIDVENGVLKVADNKIEVFLGIKSK